MKTAYGANYERLVALKDKYEPTNFFRLNQNIKPSMEWAVDAKGAILGKSRNSEQGGGE